jgi:mannose/cellobiose epimerase-like protein (N-acyl-D-glucosamine 2-epimerase family)
MKSAKTTRQDTYKKSLTSLLDSNPEAHLVKNRYKVMMYLLNKEWSNLLSQTDKEVMKEFLKDVIYCDRTIRKHTENTEIETKNILSQKFQIEVLPSL